MTIQPWYKSSTLITLFALMMLITLMGSVFAQSIPRYLEPSNARIRVQVDYALSIGQQVAYFLERYKGTRGEAASENWLTWFTDGLLKQASDPVVLKIFGYQPDKEFTLQIRNHPFIEPKLRNLELVYRFKGKRWILDYSENLPAWCDPLDFKPLICTPDACKETITHYCANPDLNVIPPAGRMHDVDWCPLWHQFVMPKEICPPTNRNY